MSATKSIIMNFIRQLQGTPYILQINLSDITQKFKEALDYHTEVLKIETEISEDLFLRVDKNYIIEKEEHRAIHMLAESLIKNKRLFKITQIKTPHGIATQYELNVLIDREF